MFLSQVTVGTNICESSETYCCHPIFASCEVNRIRESRKFLFVESGIGIFCRIRNPGLWES